MANSNKEIQSKFQDWLRRPANQRDGIESEAEWARRHGVTDRTLRRWKTSPEFMRQLEEPPAHTPAAPAESTPDEADYRVVKTALVEGAKNGNPKYLELYFRTYGKPFVEEEVASRATDLAGMDLEDLVIKALTALAPETLARHLESRGWGVTRP